jgi:hypothetical protein
MSSVSTLEEAITVIKAYQERRASSSQRDQIFSKLLHGTLSQQTVSMTL